MILFEFRLVRWSAPCQNFQMMGTFPEQSPDYLLLGVVCWAQTGVLTMCVCCIFPLLTDPPWISAMSDYVCQDGGLFAEHWRVRLEESPPEIGSCSALVIATSSCWWFEMEFLRVKKKSVHPSHVKHSFCCTAKQIALCLTIQCRLFTAILAIAVTLKAEPFILSEMLQSLPLKDHDRTENNSVFSVWSW